MGLYTKIIDLQNLNRAWLKIKSNDSAPGVDGIRVDEFDSNIKENLYQLYIELKEKRYTPKPLKLVKIRQNEKERTIGLLCIRDKIVQQSINIQLNRIYDNSISKSAFAYRNGKSALHAISYIESVIKVSKKDLWAMKLDIKDFFENINTNMLMQFLKRRIKEDDVLNLILLCLNASYVNYCGEIKSHAKGLYQGAILSPVLSNIYMDDVDKFIEHKDMPYVRYSDDIIILGPGQNELEKLKEEIICFLGKMDLGIKEEKTEIVSLKEGITFLGYKLDHTGKSISKKAEDRLKEKIEDIWFSKDCTLEEKLDKCKRVIGGWEQYYRGGRKISDIIEYAVLLYFAVNENDVEQINVLKNERNKFDNIYYDIMKMLSVIWKNQNEDILELLEYEQYYKIFCLEKDKASTMNSASIKQLLENYRLLIVNQDKEYFIEIMQIYADEHCYNKARKISEYIREHDLDEVKESDTNNILSEIVTADKDFDIKLDAKEENLYMEVFLAREDIYAKATINMNGKYTYNVVQQPFSEIELREHIIGKNTFAGYIQRNNQTVKYIVFDIDISKKNILEIGDDKELLNEYLKKAGRQGKEILKILEGLGLKGYVEFSGYRGYHIWIFFSEWISVRYANLLQDIILSKLSSKEYSGINIECFPNKAKIKEKQMGQLLKLPWGIHYVSGKRSYFVDNEFNIIQEQKDVLYDIKKYDCSTIKRIIAMNSTEEFHKKETSVENDCSELGNLPETVKIVLENCGLQRYLCLKAKRTGYLSHFERLTVLYVFGHLGEVGKDFVHTVMKYTLNYQYAVTEKYIKKLPDKPISCVKLREQYKHITAEVGCNCNFRRIKDCYPSPVLHVVKEIGADNTELTIPTTKKVTKEKEKVLYQELNIHKRTEEIVEKLIELKKQNRGVEKAIKRHEEELGSIFDHLKINAFELEMGFLIRKQTENGVEWVIEL